jgi:hypothetical protein
MGFELITTVHFTIYGRSWCHLCDDMRDALQTALQAALPIASGALRYSIEMIDIDADARVDPALLALYDELVPVLLAGKNGLPARQLCHYHLDYDRLSAFLST